MRAVTAAGGATAGAGEPRSSASVDMPRAERALLPGAIPRNLSLTPRAWVETPRSQTTRATVAASACAQSMVRMISTGMSRSAAKAFATFSAALPSCGGMPSTSRWPSSWARVKLLRNQCPVAARTMILCPPSVSEYPSFDRGTTMTSTPKALSTRS